MTELLPILDRALLPCRSLLGKFHEGYRICICPSCRLELREVGFDLEAEKSYYSHIPLVGYDAAMKTEVLIKIDLDKISH